MDYITTWKPVRRKWWGSGGADDSINESNNDNQGDISNGSQLLLAGDKNYGFMQTTKIRLIGHDLIEK